MLTIIRENAAAISLTLMLAGGISAGGIAYYKVDQLVEGQREIRVHIQDTQRHNDPVRDPQEIAEIKERLRRIEEKLDRREIRDRRRDLLNSN